MNAKTNPLYVVTEGGKVVEEANSLLDVIVKKFGLEPVLEIFSSLVSMMTDQVGNYGFFLYLQGLVDDIVAFLESLVEKATALRSTFLS